MDVSGHGKHDVQANVLTALGAGRRCESFCHRRLVIRVARRHVAHCALADLFGGNHLAERGVSRVECFLPAPEKR